MNQETKMGKQNITTLLIIGFFLIMIGCENEVVDSIYDPEAVGNDAPVITAVQPDSVYALIDNVTITGTNFSDDPLRNFVYFGNKKASIVECSDNQIIAVAPYIQGDTLTAKVGATGAYAFGDYSPYRIIYAAIEYGGVSETHSVSAVAMGDSEKVYICSEGLMKVQFIAPGDQSPQDHALLPTDQLTTGFTNMTMGPNGSLYGTNRKKVYSVSPDGAQVAEYITATSNAYDIEFDANGNMFIGSRGAIDCVNPVDTTKVSYSYDRRQEFKSLRVFAGYLYASVIYTGTDTTIPPRGVWRSEITDAAGTLGALELVLDWNLLVTYLGPDILAITFDSDGVLYLGVGDVSGYGAVYMVEPVGGSYLAAELEALYLPDPVLQPPVANFVWGDQRYLYVNRMGEANADKRLIRVDMRDHLSAPYYGRQ